MHYRHFTFLGLGALCGLAGASPVQPTGTMAFDFATAMPGSTLSKVTLSNVANLQPTRTQAEAEVTPGVPLDDEDIVDIMGRDIIDNSGGPQFRWCTAICKSQCRQIPMWKEVENCLELCIERTCDVFTGYEIMSTCACPHEY